MDEYRQLAVLLVVVAGSMFALMVGIAATVQYLPIGIMAALRAV